MTTRVGLRSTARAELNDSGGTALWSDGLLNEWLVEGIRDYGRHLPREASTSLTSVAGQAEYGLPADCQRVARVEHPVGVFRVPDPLSAGDGGVLGYGCWVSGEGSAYEVWGSFGSAVLMLRPAPTAAGEAIGVRYLATYAEPAADGDVLATPAQDDHLLVWYVAGRALQWLGLDESKRQRWERERGASAQAAADEYLGLYREALARRERRAAPRRLVVRG